MEDGKSRPAESDYEDEDDDEEEDLRV